MIGKVRQVFLLSDQTPQYKLGSHSYHGASHHYDFTGESITPCVIGLLEEFRMTLIFHCFSCKIPHIHSLCFPVPNNKNLSLFKFFILIQDDCMGNHYRHRSLPLTSIRWMKKKSTWRCQVRRASTQVNLYLRREV